MLSRVLTSTSKAEESKLSIIIISTPAMRCPYCSSPSQSQPGKSVTECTSCCRITSERHFSPLSLFHLTATDSPLLLTTSDLPPTPPPPLDPFLTPGFITAFSTLSLSHFPVFLSTSLSSSGHLAELERVFEAITPSSGTGSSVVVDYLRAYLQIIDVASILGLEYDISDHAFELFRDCSSATCLRNRSVEALATAALVQAIREAQQPRTLQEISLAANLPQKEIGKYIKILGEALQLSQPINSNSIAVHMPRFCTLLQLNKSAQELATHIGEVVINKCFCTRRNPISISAAAIYLACQLEDKRKTQAEICKITGLTEVTLRKVYKELLENWDDLLPSNYTPAVPPEKAFPTTTIASSRSSSMKDREILEEREKHPEVKPSKPTEREKHPEIKPSKPTDCVKASGERKGGSDEMDIDTQANDKQGLEKDDNEPKGGKSYTMGWQFLLPASTGVNSSLPFGQQPKVGGTNFGDLNEALNQSGESKQFD